MQNDNYFDNKKQSKLPQSPQNTQSLRTYKTTLFVEILLIMILAVANITVRSFYSAPNNPAQISDTSACKHRTKDGTLSLVENLTKDEATDIIKNMHGETKCIPEGLLPEKLKLKPNEFDQKILYSYDDVAEVPNIAQDSVMGLDRLFSRRPTDAFLIDETTDFYTIVSVDDSKISCGELDEYQSTILCYRGISFNRKYLDHHEKVEGNSHSDEMVFNDLSPDFVELVLKIIMATDIWNSNSLYDYYFEDDGDSFTLTGIYFGVGVNMNSLKSATTFNIPYAINIYEKKLILDKSTRKVSWGKYDSNYGEEVTSNILKSLPLSNDDLIEIQAVIYGLSDDETAELNTVSQ